ncbi:hypothetical protein AB3S75_036718 [Citrus x aurantiifolia]
MGQVSSNFSSSSARDDQPIAHAKTIRSRFTGRRKTHPIHRHKLELKSYKKPYNCDGCKELGFGARYRCDKCNFDLHQDCMLAAPIAHHDFFKNSTFKIFHQPPQKCSDYCRECQSYCDACAKPVRGLYYHCEKEGWDLHPCCRNLPNNLPIENIKFKLRNKVSSKCIWCKKKNLEGTVSGIRGWSYVSECKEYHFHVHCAMDMVIDGWRNGAFNNQDGNSLAALENLELPLLRQYLSGNRRSSSKFTKVVKIVLKTIVGILLGDPTVVLTGILVDLVAK